MLSDTVKCTATMPIIDIINILSVHAALDRLSFADDVYVTFVIVRVDLNDFWTYRKHCAVSLGKPLYPLLSTGTQDDRISPQHD